MELASITSNPSTFSNIYLGGKSGGSSGMLKLNPNGVAWKSRAGASETIDGNAIRSATWIQIGANSYQLELGIRGGATVKFDGFTKNDFEIVKKFLDEHFKIGITTDHLSTKGWNWGTAEFQGTTLKFVVAGNRAFEIPLSDVARCVAQKDSVSLELNNDDTTEETALAEIRFHVPPGSIRDESKEEEEGELQTNAAQIFHEKVLAKADIVDTTGKGVVMLEGLPLLVPRGRYNFEMFPNFMKLYGKTFDYKIKYQNIVNMYQLPKPDNRHVYFVVSLDPPIKQGSMRYQHMVIQFPKEEEVEVDVNIPEDSQKERYAKLQSHMKGFKYDICTRVFKALSGKKVVVPKEFQSASKTSAVRCSYKANEGYLFPLDKSFFFIHKPPLRIRYDEISSIEFARFSASKGRTFDLVIHLSSGTNTQFTGIQRNECEPLIDFIQSKKIRINTESIAESQAQSRLPEVLEDESSESEDEDFEEESEEEVPEEYDEDYEHPLSDQEGEPSTSSSKESSRSSSKHGEKEKEKSKSKHSEKSKEKSSSKGEKKSSKESSSHGSSKKRKAEDSEGQPSAKRSKADE